MLSCITNVLIKVQLRNEHFTKFRIEKIHSDKTIQFTVKLYENLYENLLVAGIYYWNEGIFVYVHSPSNMKILKLARKSVCRTSWVKILDHFYSFKVSLSSAKCFTKFATFIKVSSNFVFISNFRTSLSKLISRQRLCNKAHDIFEENWVYANLVIFCTCLRVIKASFKHFSVLF